MQAQPLVAYDNYLRAGRAGFQRKVLMTFAAQPGNE